jgi:hypothetical protein
LLSVHGNTRSRNSIRFVVSCFTRDRDSDRDHALARRRRRRRSRRTEQEDGKEIYMQPCEEDIHAAVRREASTKKRLIDRGHLSRRRRRRRSKGTPDLRSPSTP